MPAENQIPSCGTCEWFEVVEPHPDWKGPGVLGCCRRFPSKRVIPAGRADRPKSLMYPTARSGDWCGEYEKTGPGGPKPKK